MQQVINECNQMMKQTLACPTFKDSDWLMIEVCREHQRDKCKRCVDACRYAHPPANVEVQGGRVVCCYDFIKDRCKRFDPPCKYFHPPQHLRDQLIQNGRNNLVLRKSRLSTLSQHLFQAKASSISMTVNGMLNGYQNMVPRGGILVPGAKCMWNPMPSHLGANVALWRTTEMATGAESCYRMVPVAANSTSVPDPQWMNGHLAEQSIRLDPTETIRYPTELHHSTSSLSSSAFHIQNCHVTGVEYNGTVYYPPAFTQLPKQPVRTNGDRCSSGHCQTEFTTQQVISPQWFPVLGCQPNFIMQGY